MNLKTVASLVIITTTLTLASTQENVIETESIAQHKEYVKNNYQTMTTEQIQIEVEKYSNDGKLSFDLGLELIKRWTNS